MLATIICAVIFIAILFFLAMLWEIFDLLKVNTELREANVHLAEDISDEYTKNKKLEEDNARLLKDVHSLSSQLMVIANMSNKSIDHNEGD